MKAKSGQGDYEDHSYALLEALLSSEVSLMMQHSLC